MHILDILQTEAKKLIPPHTLTDIAAVLGMIISFLLGWEVASTMFYSPVAHCTEYCFTAAFAVFTASYIVTYSKYFALSPYFYHSPSGHKLLLYRVLPLIQAFTSGVILHIYRLSIATNADAYGSEIVFKMYFTVLGAITISTWLIRYLTPALGVALMPLFVFTSGTIISSAILKSVGIKTFTAYHQYIAGAASHIFSLSGTTFPLGIVSILLQYAGYAAVVVGFCYAVARPYMVYMKWERHHLGSALNGFIAVIIVVLPCFSGGNNLLTGKSVVPSVMNAITFTQASPFSYLVWSWMIGNLLSFIVLPNKFHKLHPKRRQYVATNQAPVQTDRQDASIKSPPVGRKEGAPCTVKKRLANKIAPPSDENKKRFIASLYGQKHALNRLWNGAVYPVLSGQKKFGSAILLGPTGVGKTDSAKKLADIFYSGRLLRFDMNQFGTEMESTRLFGAPPGYIGSDQGGKLPHGLREKSPCIILFDEVEKAHPAILQTLLQFCGEGYAEDSRGQRFEATGSIILMTSNIWPDRADELWTMPQDKLKAALKGYVSNRFELTGPVHLFSPEFIGRVNSVVPFKPFTKEIASLIIAGMMESASRQFNISFAEGSSMAIVSAIDLSEGFRGLQNAFDDWIMSFLSNIKPVPRDSHIELLKKGGKIYISLKTMVGEVVAQEIKNIQKGYAIDLKKLEDWQVSPLKKILGQDAQITEIVEHLQIAASGFVVSPGRPMGIFLLAGPTGVGKTETARALAKWLFDGRLIKKDMGEYQSPLDGARLFGDRIKRGDLTKEVQEAGSCVVLLDEIEKANTKVLDTLLAPFDQGVMTDAAVNMRVSFKNTVIIMTTNLKPDSDKDTSILATLDPDERRDLFAYHFKKELLGRIDKVLVYNKLPEDVVVSIIKERVNEIVERKKEDEGVLIQIDDDVYEWIMTCVQASSYGIRGADGMIAATLGLAVSKIVDAETIHIYLQDDQIIAEVPHSLQYP